MGIISHHQNTALTSCSVQFFAKTDLHLKQQKQNMDHTLSFLMSVPVYLAWRANWRVSRQKNESNRHWNVNCDEELVTAITSHTETQKTQHGPWQQQYQKENGRTLKVQILIFFFLTSDRFKVNNQIRNVCIGVTRWKRPAHVWNILSHQKG